MFFVSFLLTLTAERSWCFLQDSGLSVARLYELDFLHVISFSPGVFTFRNVYVVCVYRVCVSAGRRRETVRVVRSACCVWALCGRSAATVSVRWNQYMIDTPTPNKSHKSSMNNNYYFVLFYILIFYLIILLFLINLFILINQKCN